LMALLLMLVSLPVLGLPLAVGERTQGLLIALVLIDWWLGVPGSPVGVAPRAYLPLVTAAQAFGMVVLGLGLTRLEADQPGRLDRFAGWLGFVLALLAALLTRGTVNGATLGTLLLATAALAILALECRRLAAAHAGGLLWALSCLAGALEAARL